MRFMTPWRSTAHFRNAALTPVLSMPSVISRTNSDAIALVGRYARNPGSSRNA